MSATRQEALALYRQLLRTCRQWPVEHMRWKLYFNIKELVHHRSKVTESDKIQKFLDDGKTNLNTLRKIATLDTETLKTIFSTLEHNQTTQ